MFCPWWPCSSIGICFLLTLRGQVGSKRRHCEKLKEYKVRFYVWSSSGTCALGTNIWFLWISGNPAKRAAKDMLESNKIHSITKQILSQVQSIKVTFFLSRRRKRQPDTAPRECGLTHYCNGVPTALQNLKCYGRIMNSGRTQGKLLSFWKTHDSLQATSR